MPIAADYPFLEIVGTMIIFFAWVVWIWCVVSILMDVFRRHDISGWIKALWTIFIIIVPFLGVFIYLIAEGKGMAERNVAEVKERQAAFDSYVKQTAGSGGGAASEIASANDLLKSGAITQEEFEQIKAKALAGG